MIVWLASYPRSGNTLLRMLLKRAFGIPSFSLYDEKPGPDHDAGIHVVGREIGARHHGLAAKRFHELASAKKRTYFVKTHDAPWDEAPAIYVVRDGRAATVSYFHYLRLFDIPPVSIADVVLGRVLEPLAVDEQYRKPFLSWSEHFEAWRREGRARALVLKYEDLTGNPAGAIRQIADFLNLEPTAEFTNDFEGLQRLWPEFFRKGSNDDAIKELQGEALELFWIMHGHLMDQLGYVKSMPPISVNPRKLLAHQRDHAIELHARMSIDRQRVSAELRAVDADRRAKDGVIARVGAELKAVEADRRAKDEVIARVGAELKAVEADRQAKDEVIARVSAELKAVEADRRAKDEVIARVSVELKAVEADRQAKDEVIAHINAELKAIDADRQAKGDVVARLAREQSILANALRTKKEIISELSRRLKAVKVGRHAVFVGHVSARVLDALQNQEK